MQLVQAPVSLASSLQEYLNDPNFEQNRIEYKASKGAVDRNTKDRNRAPSAQVPRGIVSVNHSHPNFAHAYSRQSYDISELDDYRTIGQTPVPPSLWRS